MKCKTAESVESEDRGFLLLDEEMHFQFFNVELICSV